MVLLNEHMTMSIIMQLFKFFPIKHISMGPFFMVLTTGYGCCLAILSNITYKYLMLSLTASHRYSGPHYSYLTPSLPLWAQELRYHLTAMLSSYHKWRNTKCGVTYLMLLRSSMLHRSSCHSLPLCLHLNLLNFTFLAILR